MPQVVGQTPPKGQLMVHTHGARRVTLDQLKTLPEPESQGPMHRPIAHHRLVDILMDQVADRGWEVARTQLAVNKDAKRVFGVMDITGITGLGTDDMGTTFGFRNSVDRSLGIRGVAGGRVFVCDNLCLSGAETILNKKNTIRLHVVEKVSLALDAFVAQSHALIDDVEGLKQRSLADWAAKNIIYDVFDSGALPLKLFPTVSALYFKPQEEHPDCHSRTAWGLHNACTRSIKVLRDNQRFESSMALGRAFKLADTAPTLY